MKGFFYTQLLPHIATMAFFTNIIRAMEKDLDIRVPGEVRLFISILSAFFWRRLSKGVRVR